LSAVEGDALPAAPALSKDLRQRHVTMISIGGIIGAGLFVGSSAGIASIGPAVVVSYLLAGIVVLLVMRQLGEMAAANPDVGSFTEFARQGLGNWAGFIAGWTYWYFWVAVVCVEALAGAKLLHNWFDLPIWAWGVILLAAMTCTNLWSTRSYGEFEFWFASIKVVAIVAFIVIGAVALGLHAPNPAGRFANLTGDHGFAPFGVLSVLGGVTSVVFALTGAEIATIAAAESDEPGKAVARMTNQVVVRILLFYVLSIFLIVTLVPWRSIHSGDSPFAITLERLGIPGAAIVMNLIVLTAVLSCLNSGLYVSSRVLFTLAARGDAPGAMVVINRRKVPVRAILVVMAFALVAMATSARMPNLFGFLIDASGALMLVVYGLVSLAQIVLRRRFERDAPGRLVVRMWLFPWLSWFAVASMAAILAVMALTPSSFHQFAASMAVPGLALAVFLAVKFWRRRAGAALQNS
jgi:GABA permease